MTFSNYAVRFRTANGFGQFSVRERSDYYARQAAARKLSHINVAIAPDSTKAVILAEEIHLSDGWYTLGGGTLYPPVRAEPRLKSEDTDTICYLVNNLFD